MARSIHELFEHQVALTPDADALMAQGRRISFSELNRRANRLARFLRQRGVGPEVLVGLSVEHSIALVEGMLAIFKAGGAYVPLDPAVLHKRAAAVLADARPRVLVTSRELAPRLPPAHDATVVCLDRDEHEIARCDGDDLGYHDPDALAHVLYTSGSTGQPKGVLGTHRGEVNRLQWMQHQYPYGHDEVGCLKTSLSFVDCVSEIFWPLQAGNPVVVASARQTTDPRALLSLLEARGVTRLVAVPSLLGAFLDTAPMLAETLPRLRYWMSCGEPLSVELASRLLGALPRCRLINLYGSTEVSADATFFEVERGRLQTSGDRAGCVPIGRPIRDMTVTIVDERGRPVAPGVCGELLIGGPGVCRGYLGECASGADRFVDDPSSRPRSRLYRSGDLGRLLPDGNIELVGRLDHQIKLRGYRIEPGEIEAALRRHVGVRDAIVVARQDKSGAKQLVAYVVRLAEELAEPELGRFLTESLPAYMVPARVVFVDRLPTNENGKVDRSRLPPPPERVCADKRLAPAPRTELEQLVLEVWRDVLGQSCIGVDDNYFAIGGDSLSALKMLLALEARIGKRVSDDFFDDPTVAHLARVISDSGRTFEAGAGGGGWKDALAAAWDGVVRPGGALRGEARQRALIRLRRLPEVIALALPYSSGLAWLRWLCDDCRAATLYRQEQQLIRRFLSQLGPAHQSAGQVREALVADVLHRRLEKATARTLIRSELVRALQATRSPFWRPFATIAAGASEGLFERHYRLCGTEGLEAARARGRGVIVLAHHTPLFRMAMPAIYRLGFTPTAIAGFGDRRTRQTLKSAAATAERVASIFAALTVEIHRALAAGGLVLMAGEGRKGRVRCHVPICGRLYPMRAGFAELALRTRAVVVPLTIALQDDGRIELTFHPALPRGASGQRRSTRATKMVQRYADFLHANWQMAPESLSLRRMALHLQLPRSGEPHDSPGGQRGIPWDPWNVRSES